MVSYCPPDPTENLSTAYICPQSHSGCAATTLCEKSTESCSPQLALSSETTAAAPQSTKVDRLPLRKNFAWTLAGNVTYAVCQWAMLIAIAKLGTAEMLGQFALGLSVAGPVFMLTSFQLRVVLATDARNEYRLGHYLAPRLLGTAAGLIIVASYVLISHLDWDTALVVLFVGAAKTVETFSDIIYGFWQKHERFDKIAIALAGRGFGSVAAIAGILYLTRNMALAASAMAFFWFLWLATYERNGTKNLLGSLRQEEVLRAEWNKAKCSRLVVLSLPLGIVMLLISLNTNIPRYFVEHYCGESALGYFAAVAYFSAAGNTVMAALGQSAIPRLARYADSDRPAFARLLRNMVWLGAVLGILGIALALFLGPTFLRLAYRADYVQYANIFTWLMAAAAVAYVGSMLGYGMMAVQLFRPQVPLFLAATAATTFACWFLTPRFGVIGSAYAVLIGSAVSCAGSAYLILIWWRRQSQNSLRCRL